MSEIKNMILQASVKSEAAAIERINRQDLRVSWVRAIRGGPLGRYTEACVDHPIYGNAKILFGIPMSPEAVAGYIECFINPKVFRSMVASGETVNLGVPTEQLKFNFIPHKHTAKLNNKPKWSQIATSRPKKLRRLVFTIVAPQPVKPEGWWEGDPIRDRRIN